ncbi:3-isopropylmalate dehydratase large subunit [Fodinicurvata fenggangensis]|uniref:3-isopropylmalate dehydratase large subunit n=1 Tax=Fodinicurvata fenggangensis TaxID=1121830 RepID=UPI0009DD569D|nr:3-isopropylmalate dehydratase large subunit [Fodinicurvata fenggangensis]
MPATMFDKIWDSHLVTARDDGRCLLYVDRHIVHDATSQAFAMLDAEGFDLRRPDLTLGTADHYVATGSHTRQNSDQIKMVEDLKKNAQRNGITSYGSGHPRQGIVHVVGPELGFTLPGSVLICADSHTATHGALGALAFGVGQSEVMHVLATQSLWQNRPKQMRITVEGELPFGVTAKDLILRIITTIGAGGGTGHVIEYSGGAIRNLSVEGRMTLCNMSIEAGARAGMVAPDNKVFEWLYGRPFAPTGKDWAAAIDQWRKLPSDPDAQFDSEIILDSPDIEPMVTWGTSPQDALPITAQVPDPDTLGDSQRCHAGRRALEYMGLSPGTPLEEITIDRVFIGSCTNSRLEDLREAAAVAQGRKVRVPSFVVPGSASVKAAAEAEGLHKIFKEAGFLWSDPGCSMCVAMNGDAVPEGERCASTSNRNFEGRQGPGARTHLMNPAMAAAAAVTGHLTDVRYL